MSHSHSSFIPRKVKRIKRTIISCIFTGEIIDCIKYYYKLLITVQEKGLLSKSQGKMSGKQ